MGERHERSSAESNKGLGRSWCRRGTLDTSRFARGPTSEPSTWPAPICGTTSTMGWGRGSRARTSRSGWTSASISTSSRSAATTSSVCGAGSSSAPTPPLPTTTLCMSPQPWARTGSGEATDGKPKFDLETFDEEFFDRLRGRVTAAGDRGMYVDVMLFEGWDPPEHGADTSRDTRSARATMNGVSIGSILDYQVLPLDPRVQESPGALHPEGRGHGSRSPQRPV